MTITLFVGGPLLHGGNASRRASVRAYVLINSDPDIFSERSPSLVRPGAMSVSGTPSPLSSPSGDLMYLKNVVRQVSEAQYKIILLNFYFQGHCNEFQVPSADGSTEFVRRLGFPPILFRTLDFSQV